ncbi:hypothetical protein WDU94_001553 [Cyamophila willieti]
MCPCFGLIVFSMVQLNYSKIAAKKYDWTPRSYPMKGDIPNVPNICQQGCGRILLNATKPVCGGRIDRSTSEGDKIIHAYINFMRISSARCNGATCHLEVGTDNVNWHAGVDCTQKGTAAACSCIVYEKIEVP